MPPPSSHDIHAAGCPPDAVAGGGPWRPGVISNPRSGGNKGGRIRDVRRCLQGYPDIPHREVRTVAELRAALDDFAAREVNLVVVNSGDGTVQGALTILFNRRPFRTPPLLALVSGGTTNMTHHDLGLPGDHVRALSRLLNWVCHGEGEARIRRRTVLRVRRPNDPEPVYGFFFGAACIFKGIQFFHASVHRMGLSGDAAHLLILSRFLWGLFRRHDALVAPVSAAIRTEHGAVPRRDYLMLLITTLDRLIMGVRPFWADTGGRLRLTAVGARPRGLLRALPALIRGRAIPHAVPENGYLSCAAGDVRIDMSGGFAVDGELFSVDPGLGPVRVQDGGTADFLRL
jgi:diacylglycerol kinase (ATP)